MVQGEWTSVIAVGLSDQERRLLTAFAGEISDGRGVRVLNATTVDGGLNRVAIFRGNGKSCVGLISARMGAPETIRFVRWFAGSEGLVPVIVLGGKGDEAVLGQALAARACDVLLHHELDADRLLRSLRMAQELTRRDTRVEEARTNTESTQAQLDLVWDTTEEGLLLVDGKHRICRFNAVAAELLERPDRQLLGAAFSSLGWVANGPAESGLSRFAAVEVQTEIELPSGAREKVGVRVRRVGSRRAPTDEQLRIVFLRRRGEGRELRVALEEARHFAGLGRFVAGAAHDASNLLTPLLGYSELLLAKLPAESDLVRYAEEIHRSARLATELLRRLRDRGQNQPSIQLPVSADRSLADLAGILQSLVGKNIEVSNELNAGNIEVSVRTGEIEQIVLNLAANARDAMPLGGRLAMRTRSEGGARWILEVEDSGAGIGRENLERVFEPSFTTKAVGQGTGLGLWIVRSIVDQAGGKVRIESTPGVGTRVFVELPASRSPRPSAFEGDLS